jgi:hypothetical protein
MALYLLVRDNDGAVLAELDSDESAFTVLKQLISEDEQLEGVSVVRVDTTPARSSGRRRSRRLAPPDSRDRPAVFSG